jgi:hypothetical protein
MNAERTEGCLDPECLRRPGNWEAQVCESSIPDPAGLLRDWSNWTEQHVNQRGARTNFTGLLKEQRSLESVCTSE